jgi:hypothetical protein
MSVTFSETKAAGKHNRVNLKGLRSALFSLEKVELFMKSRPILRSKLPSLKKYANVTSFLAFPLTNSHRRRQIARMGH